MSAFSVATSAAMLPRRSLTVFSPHKTLASTAATAFANSNAVW